MDFIWVLGCFAGVGWISTLVLFLSFLRLRSQERYWEEKQEEFQHLLQEKAILHEQVTHYKERLREQQEFFLKTKEDMTHTFQSLSSQVLQSNNKSFLDLAKTTLEKFQETARQDLTTRQISIQEMLTPVKEALKSVDVKIGDLEKTRLSAYESLKEQVQNLLLSQKDLKAETTNLVNALRAPMVRGRWGEMQLKRVVEMAGMLSHCDFAEQVSIDTQEGRRRPDMVVHLPGGKKIIVDAKAPLAAYLDALEMKDEEKKQEKLKDHARHVRAHMTALSSKAYWDQSYFQPAPEFVILFLPGEIFFSAALEQDPSLIEVGVEQQVILATPTTLIALLRAVAYGWRQEQLEENAKEIAAMGRELHKRVCDMGQHMTKLGRNLGSAVDAYNQTVGNFERRVLVSARRFKELGAASQEVEEVPQIEKAPRALVETGG